jgi:MFS family permease
VQAGLALALLSAPIVVFSPIGGRLADRYGRRRPAVSGCVILTVGLVPLAVAPGITAYGLFASLALAGTGVGLSTAGLQASAIEAIDPGQAGVAAGLFSSSRYIGGFVASIVVASLLDEAHGLADFQAVFVIALAGAVVSVIATLALLPTPPPRKAVSR